MTLPTLPDDVMQLKQLVLDNFQRAEQEELRARNEHQRAELYKFQLENLKRLHFGQSSEKRSDPPGQQLLFELPARPVPADTEPAVEALASHTEPKKHGGGRKPLPKDLPRERRQYTLPEEQRKCSCCGETMQPFGEESSEQLEYIPASLKVIEHARIKYACKACQEKPAIAPPPEKVTDKGLAGPGLLAWIAVSKFGDHQPLYRQENTALLALAAAVSGCRQLIRFMTEQQGPDWRDQDKVLDAAESDFLEAQKWLRKRRKKGGENV